MRVAGGTHARNDVPPPTATCLITSAIIVGPEASESTRLVSTAAKTGTAWTWHTWQGGQPPAFTGNAKPAEESSLAGHLVPSGKRRRPTGSTRGITGGWLNGITSASIRRSSPERSS